MPGDSRYGRQVAASWAKSDAGRRDRSRRRLSPIVTLDDLSGMIDFPPCDWRRMVSVVYDHVEQAPSPMFRGTNTWRSQYDVLPFTYVVVCVHSVAR